MMSNTRHRAASAWWAAPAPMATNSSSRIPYNHGLRAQSKRTTSRMIERVTTIALNIETRTPMIRTRAKPRIADDPSEYRIVAVMSDDTFESRMEFQARLKPASTAAGRDLPTPQLLLHPLEDEDVRVHGHADREHEARDAGQGQRDRDEPEDRVDDDRVVDEREARDRARQPVVQQHEGDDEQDPDQRRRSGSGPGTGRRASR